MSSRKHKPAKRKVRTAKRSKSSSKKLHIFSDFDDTLVPRSVGALLVLHYLFKNPHHEPLRRRVGRVAYLTTAGMRRKHFERYYDCLRRIPQKNRQRLLSKVPISGKWLRTVKDIRLKHRATSVGLTIISRNCVDVVHDWIMQNRKILKDNHIHIDSIIANRPLHNPSPSFVRERADLKHIDYLGLGQMMEEQKKFFLDKHKIYIGDSDDAVLKPFVQEFVQL